MRILQTALLVLIVGLLLSVAACQDAAPSEQLEETADRKNPGTPIVVEGSTMEFDPATVMRGAAGAGWGLGSYRVWVLGRAGGQCVFELFDEVEGGYTYYLCKVPVDGPPVRIYEENGDLARSFDLEEARVLSRGNLLLGLHEDEPPPLKWEQRHLTDTSFMVGVADLEGGDGAAAEEGQQITLHATVFTNESRKTPLLGFEDGRTLRFKQGDGTAGPALDAALDGMKEGGIRLAMIREEVGGALNKVFGPFNPGTLMTVKLELEAVK